jgi:hypothetical protein
VPQLRSQAVGSTEPEQVALFDTCTFRHTRNRFTNKANQCCSLGLTLERLPGALNGTTSAAVWSLGRIALARPNGPRQAPKWPSKPLHFPPPEQSGSMFNVRSAPPSARPMQDPHLSPCPPIRDPIHQHRLPSVRFF